MAKEKPETEITVRAKVRVTLEIDVTGGGWPADVTMQQVHNQAVRAAETEVRLMVQDRQGHGHSRGVRLIECEPIAVLVPKPKDRFDG